MKIVTGISTSQKPDEISAYAKAGVDEFFIGYVPKSWSDEYGFEISCNRREHSMYQYKELSEIETVVDLIHQEKRKVYLTLNAHELNTLQLKLVLQILKSIQHVPFDGFILSNFALMLALRNAGIDKPFNISIGAGNSTCESLSFYQENIPNITRFILPRKFTLSELEKMAIYGKDNALNLEVFLLGDPCHFSDEYCFTWHGAANASLCNSPMYMHKEAHPLVHSDSWKKDIVTKPIHTFYQARKETLEDLNRSRSQYENKRNVSVGKEEIKMVHILARIAKCGLCTIPKLQSWGVDAIKLPLRGYDIQTNLEVIKLVKTVMNESNANPEFCKKLLNAPSFCSGKNCYYNYPNKN